MTKITVLAVLLAGCVTTGARGPEVTEGTENAVTVNWSRSSKWSDGVLGVAEAHCAKYGRHAQFAGKPTDFDITYNCVK